MSPQTKRFSDLLERVISKNVDFLKSASDALRSKKNPAEVLREAPENVLRDTLALYRDMRLRILEIEKVRQVIRTHRENPEPKLPLREKLLEDVDVQIRTLTEELAKRSPAFVDGLPVDDPQSAVPAGRWLREEKDSMAFIVNARLLEDLEYGPAAAGQPSTQREERRIDRSGRCFTLISLRGPAPALDAILPGLLVREHDILERYSATEIRGVLTHLRTISEHEVSRLIRRFLSTGYSDVKCLFVGIDSPVQIDDAFLRALEQTAGKMQPGECRSRSAASLL